ncbi:MAG: S24/S26 family peptidase [Oscillospiraceae bacterium]|nr:S24/S26 family peptidase [Oscillospiraceae bacterium]
MPSKVDVQDILPLIREKLEQGGEVSLTVTGDSMYPFLRDGRDRVTIAPLMRPLRVNDVPLYLRAGGGLVLHRVMRVERDGRFACCGDHQWWLERSIRPEQVLGIAVAFRRKGRSIRAGDLGYRLTSGLWRWLRPLRRPLFALAGRLHRLRQEKRSETGE